MKLVRLLPVAALILTAVAPSSGRAATTHAVDVVSGAFDPRGVAAVNGDTITWTHRNGGNHTVTAYQGATFDQPLTGAPGSTTFSHAFTGGTILYRCKNHSTLEQAGGCSGMCGRISDSAPAVAPPVFTYPENGSTTIYHGFYVGGTVTGVVQSVRVEESGQNLGVAEVGGDSWSKFINLSNGTHVLRAIAIHPDGYESAPSAPLTITVNSPEDREPPVVALDDPKNPSQLAALNPTLVVATNPLTIRGQVRDTDTNISMVTIRVTDARGADVPVDYACDACGTTKTINFLVQIRPLTGLYTITVTGADGADQRASATRTVLLVR